MRSLTIAIILGMTAPSPVLAQAQDPERPTMTEDVRQEATALLEAFVEDYKFDPMAIDVTFGIKLGDHFWTVAVERTETSSRRGRLTDHAFGPHAVTIRDGAPSQPTWYFEFADIDVLRKVATGEINAGTASSQSFASDKVGLEVGEMDGFEASPGEVADLYITMSHFFTRGIPEVTRFGRANSLGTHGAQATSLHRMKGFRISFFSLGTSEVANEDPQLQRGQVPNLFIIFRGKGTLHTDGEPIVLEPGISVFVPQFVKHEIVNDGDEPLEGVLVLYGDNSDHAFGTSYPAFQQDLNDFYRSYPYRKPTQETD